MKGIYVNSEMFRKYQIEFYFDTFRTSINTRVLISIDIIAIAAVLMQLVILLVWVSDALDPSSNVPITERTPIRTFRDKLNRWRR